jgi:hypothetical protein
MKRRSTRKASAKKRVSKTTNAPEEFPETRRHALRALLDSAADRAMYVMAKDPHTLTAMAGSLVVIADLALRAEDSELLAAYRTALIQARETLYQQRAAAAAICRPASSESTAANVIDMRSWLERRG